MEPSPINEGNATTSNIFKLRNFTQKLPAKAKKTTGKVEDYFSKKLKTIIDTLGDSIKKCFPHSNPLTVKLLKTELQRAGIKNVAVHNHLILLKDTDAFIHDQMAPIRTVLRNENSDFVVWIEEVAIRDEKKLKESEKVKTVKRRDIVIYQKSTQITITTDINNFIKEIKDLKENEKEYQQIKKTDTKEKVIAEEKKTENNLLYDPKTLKESRKKIRYYKELIKKRKAEN